MTTATQGFVVSHTHWDRAWYLPFQSYRVRLVRLVDALIDMLESDPGFRAFTLDGQTVILEDYLAIRPGSRARLAELVRGGRLLVGPWYSLPDLFLPSGEAVVRNLQMGRRHAREFGEPMCVGYVPDPFGHFAQLPQVLSGFGLSSFIFMRGLGKKERLELGSVFEWEAPDGSVVLTVYEPDGYLPLGGWGHPAAFGRFDGHEVSLELARKRLHDAVEVMRPMQQERALLLPNGCDHMPPQPEIPEIIRSLNAEGGAVELVHGTLPEFLEALRAEGKPHRRFRGDLIGNWDHPVLLSVYSTRIYLKEQNHRAQSLLVRVAEPLSGLARILADAPEARSLFDEAWRLLLKNHAHDDICGCSVDPVHDADEVRFSEVCHVVETLATESLESLWKAGFVPPAGTGKRAADVVVWNPHPFLLRSRVECDVHFADGDEWDAPSPERPLFALDALGRSVVVSVLGTERKVVRQAFLDTVWGRRYRVAFDIDLPPLGYELVHLFEGEGDPVVFAASVASPRIDSDAFEVWVDAGRVMVREKASHRLICDALAFEYDVDTGDTYSVSLLSGVPLRRAELEKATAGPGGSLALQYRLRVPEWVKCERLPGEAPMAAPSEKDPDADAGAPSVEWGPEVELRIDVELRATRSLECRVSYENRASNGRLRAVVATGLTTTSVRVDGHFRLAERGLPAEALPKSSPYPGEHPYATFHQGDFLLAEEGKFRFWSANRGLPEAELLARAEGSFAAITLHRAVGMLSVFGGTVRRCQAGPSIPTPGAQCLRRLEHHFSMGWGEIATPDALRRALVGSHGPWAVQMPRLPHVKGKGALARRFSLLSWDEPEVLLSSCHECERTDTLALRLYNTASEERAVTLNWGIPVRAVADATLDETWDDHRRIPHEGSCVRITLKPHQIRTLLVEASRPC